MEEQRYPDKIILFDGVCNLCEKAVQFIIQRDPQGLFHFASLQSSIGHTLQQQHQLPAAFTSFIYIENGKPYLRSTAALKVAGKLTGGWKLLSILLIVPQFLRDFVYDFIARNRYRWMGKKEACWLPTPELKKRFLE